MKKRTKFDIMASMQWRHVVVGGTFDHIHKGHKTFLSRAFSEGEKVTIGLTTDKYVRNAKWPMLNGQCYDTRKKQLETWLEQQGVLGRTTIVPIDNAYGPSITCFEYDAIVVSKETEKVAKKINSKRNELHLLPLAIIVVPMILAEDTEAISSTRILNGEIDQTGKLILPEFLRKTLTKPIGTLISDGVRISSSRIPHNALLISVGDTTTTTLLSQGITPTLAIIDFQVQRQAFDWEKAMWEQLIANRTLSYFTSGPGFINKQVMHAIEGWSEDPKCSLYIIDGEEDLLVLPAILYAREGSVVYYGQPDHGIVQVDVTKEKKKTVKQLLHQFI